MNNHSLSGASSYDVVRALQLAPDICSLKVARTRSLDEQTQDGPVRQVGASPSPCSSSSLSLSFPSASSVSLSSFFFWNVGWCFYLFCWTDLECLWYMTFVYQTERRGKERERMCVGGWMYVCAHSCAHMWIWLHVNDNWVLLFVWMIDSQLCCLIE